MAEFGAAGLSSLLSSVPGIAVGLHAAIKSKDPQEFARAHKFVQDYYTYHPRTEAGQALVEGMDEIMAHWGKFTDYLIDDTQVSKLPPAAKALLKGVMETAPLWAPLGVSKVMRPGPPAGPVPAPPAARGLKPQPASVPLSQIGQTNKPQERVGRQACFEWAPGSGMRRPATRASAPPQLPPACCWPPSHRCDPRYVWTLPPRHSRHHHGHPDRLEQRRLLTSARRVRYCG